MSGHLRHIALTVEQTGDRSYAWVLIESAGGRAFVLKKGVRKHSAYLPALHEGYEELALLSACGLHEPAADVEYGSEPAAISMAPAVAESNHALQPR